MRLYVLEGDRNRLEQPTTLARSNHPSLSLPLPSSTLNSPLCTFPAKTPLSSPPSRSMLHFPTIKRINYLAPMLASVLLLVLLLSGSLEFPSLSSPVPLSPTLSLSNPNRISTAVDSIGSRTSNPFTELLPAFSKWDSQVGCAKFERKFESWKANSSAIQGTDVQDRDTCQKEGRRRHVSVLVKGWTWIPDNLEGIYSCGCGLSCAWSKSPVVVDRPDALLFEGATPPRTRRTGDPLRVYLDLEASRKPTGFEDIFIGYHASDDVQVTYAGRSFHIGRNYRISPVKRDVRKF